MTEYKFTNNWFGSNKNVWDQFIPKANPQKILEVGSYEGASACYLIDNLTVNHEIEIHCVDTWEGGIEHQINRNFAADMTSVEARFDHNINAAVSKARNKVNFFKCKEQSDVYLAKLIGAGKKNYFDFIYVDGSHQAPDVLCDAILAFKLIKIGGYIVFDDYLWSEESPLKRDILQCPKLAIDAFVNLHFQKVVVLRTSLAQLFVQKVAN